MQTYRPKSSSNIRECHYLPSALVSSGPQTGTLYVTFHNGDRYEYKSVPMAVWNNFQRDSSPGKYLSQIIKPRHQGTKMRGEADQPNPKSYAIDENRAYSGGQGAGSGAIGSRRIASAYSRTFAGGRKW